MPVYNGERFICEALDALLCQTFENFELIISDNASEDATEEICRDYAARDPRIRYTRNERNLGAAKNFNRAFSLSRGEYFKWAAYDDVCAPEFLARCVGALDAEPDVVLAYPLTATMDEGGRLLREGHDPLPSLRSPQAHDRFRRLMWSLGSPHAVFGVARRTALARTGLIRRELGSDRLLLAELSLLGDFWQVPEMLFYNRRTLSVKRIRSRTWWDPANQDRMALRAWRLLYGHLRVVRASSLSPGQKVSAWLDVVARFAAKEWHPLLGELWHAANHTARKALAR